MPSAAAAIWFRWKSSSPCTPPPPTCRRRRVSRAARRRRRRRARSGVGEPDVEQRPLGLGRVVHPLPGHAAVAGAQDHLVVADGPAEPLVVQPDAGEQGPGRHVGLRPASPPSVETRMWPRSPTATTMPSRRPRRAAARRTRAAQWPRASRASPGCPAATAGTQRTAGGPAPPRPGGAGLRIDAATGGRAHGHRTPSRRRASGVKSASVRLRSKSCGRLSLNRPMTR